MENSCKIVEQTSAPREQTGWNRQTAPQPTVDEHDFESLVAQYYPRLRRAALLLSRGNAWDADDLAQETMLQAARALEKFAGTSQVHTWLYAILLNQHRRRARSGQRVWRRCLEWFGRKPVEQEETPQQKLQQSEWRGTLWSAVAELPEAQSHTILLRFAEALSYEEIADVLNCPVGTVKSRLHHGLAALKNKLADIRPEHSQQRFATLEEQHCETTSGSEESLP